MPQPNVQLNDLILFFHTNDAKNAKKIVNRWIPHALYQHDNALVPPAQVPQEWRGAVLMTARDVDAAQKPGPPFFVVNLDQLVSPGSPKHPVPLPGDVPVPEPGTGAVPRTEGDLLVFPFTPRASDDPAELAKVPCYRVPRALYEKCPELDSQLVADSRIHGIAGGSCSREPSEARAHGMHMPLAQSRQPSQCDRSSQRGHEDRPRALSCGSVCKGLTHARRRQSRGGRVRVRQGAPPRDPSSDGSGGNATTHRSARSLDGNHARRQLDRPRCHRRACSRRRSTELALDCGGAGQGLGPGLGKGVRTDGVHRELPRGADRSASCSRQLGGDA